MAKELEESPLLGVVNHPVAPIHPPTNEEGERDSSLQQIDGRGDPPPSPESNVRRAPPEKQPSFTVGFTAGAITFSFTARRTASWLHDFYPPCRVVIVVSCDSFSQALSAFRSPLLEYSRLHYEDPAGYLTKCTEYITALEIPDGNKVNVLEKGLRGAAEKWWQCYKPMNLNFERFTELFQAQIDNQSTKSSLVAKLYGTSQGDKKSLGTFYNTSICCIDAKTVIEYMWI
ncbi:hypothetical protein TKK_0003532 [Trichogramma kaykai]